MKCWALAFVLMAGCGQSSQAKYELEKARLAAMEAEAEELMATIMAETNALLDKKERDLNLLQMQVNNGTAPATFEVDKAGNDKLLDALKRAEQSPLQKELAALGNKILIQKKIVADARKDFVD
jgi:hypothetical protein